MKSGGVDAHATVSMLRQRIVFATVACIVANGYASLTMKAICSQGGISRGAVMNQFASKRAVIAETIHYLYQNRLETFREAMQKQPAGSDDLRHAIQSYWNHVNQPDLAAFIELAAAARTDVALSDVLTPAQQAFDANLLRVCFEYFPSWTPKGEHFVLGLDLSRALIERASMDWVPRLGAVPRAVILRSLEHTLQQLRSTERSRSISSLRPKLL